jgi:hypothetical protein
MIKKYIELGELLKITELFDMKNTNDEFVAGVEAVLEYAENISIEKED